MSNTDLEPILHQAATGDARPALREAVRLKKQCANSEIDPCYAGLLQAILLSNDADTVAWTAEALQQGERLVKDVELCAKFLKRADELSGFMGSFLMGKMLLRSDPKLAYEMFSRGAKRGHVPSRGLMWQIWYGRHPRWEAVAKPFIVTAETIRISWALRRADANLRFWRYKDAFARPAQILNDRFGAAAESPFLDW
jgi:TPR repeat protein